MDIKNNAKGKDIILDKSKIDKLVNIRTIVNI